MMASSSNQETDTAAMVGDSIKKTTPPINVKTKSNLNSKTTTTKTITPSTLLTTVSADVNANSESIMSAVESSKAAKVITESKATNKSFAITSRVTTLTEASSTGSVNFFVPEVPSIVQAQVNAGNGGSSSSTNSIKKKRSNKHTKKQQQHNQHKQHEEEQPHNYRCRGNDDDTSTSNFGKSIKTSLSMTSLPPDGEKREGNDTIKAKLKVERPYNSLKKTVDRNVGSNLSNFQVGSPYNGKRHRLSWGSTSSSLHSSATFGMGSGKDDLWAAIQTNYNYIMDTNLLDSCKEARHEIENKSNVTIEHPTECCFQMLNGSHRLKGFFKPDPKDLRKWLRQKENELQNAPTLAEATTFSIAELQRHLAEHSVLYHEIVSHARVVSACIRAATEREEELQQRQLEEQQQSLDSNASSVICEQNTSSLSSTDEAITATTTNTSAATVTNSNSGNNSNSCANTLPLITTSSGIGTSSGAAKSSSSIAATSTPNSILTATSTSSSSKRSDCSLERLQNRYHLLYLKAFEVQLWLDGLLRKKTFSECDFNDNTEEKENIDEDSDEDYDNDDDADSFECDDNQNDREDVDATGVATEDDLVDVVSDLESDVTNNSSSLGGDIQRCNIVTDNVQSNNETKIETTKQQNDSKKNKANIDFDEGDDEDEKENDNDANDEVDFLNVKRRRYRSCTSFGNVLLSNRYNKNRIVSAATLTDFDADSESSDIEELLPCLQKNITGNNESQYKLRAKATKATTSLETNIFQCNFTNTAEEIELNNQNSLIHDNYKELSKKKKKKLSSEFIIDGQQTLGINNKSDLYIESSKRIVEKTKMNLANIVKAVSIHSDNEQQKKLRNSNKKILKTPSDSKMTNSIESAASLTTISQQNMQNGDQQNKKLKNIAIVSPNSHNKIGNCLAKADAISAAVADVNTDADAVNNANSNNYIVLKKKSPPVFRKRQQKQKQQTQQPHIDISKFNRSNRKSKNCAVFYFKHLDTDNEVNYNSGNGESAVDDIENGDVNVDCIGEISSCASHTSDVLKFVDASSDDCDDDDDDEGWLYTSTTEKSNPNKNTISNLFIVKDIQSSAVSSSTTFIAKKEQITMKNKMSTTGALASTHLTVTNNFQQLSPIDSLPSFSSLDSMRIAENNVNFSVDPESERAIQTKTTTNYEKNSNTISNICCSDNCDSSSSTNRFLSDTSTTTASSTIALTATEISVNKKLNHNHCELSPCTKIELNCNDFSTIQQDKSVHINDNSNKKNRSSNHNNQMNILPNATITTQLNQQKPKSESIVVAKTESLRKDLHLCTAPRHNVRSESGKPKELLASPEKRLPPRSPAKFCKPHKTIKTLPENTKVSHESIKQLVLEAEHLIRDESLKTPTKHQRRHHLQHKLVKMSSTIKKRDSAISRPIKQRVQDWLQQQPLTPIQIYNAGSIARTDDCEASAEASETDSVPQPGSDTSEGLTDSIATCMQTSTNSYGNSTERIGGSPEPMNSSTGTAQYGCGSSNQSLNVKVIKRPQTRRKSERPWSVSCLSQLTLNATQASTSAATTENVQAGLATHSISESALDSLSPGRTNNLSEAISGNQEKIFDSKSSLKRRKGRKKKHSSSGNAVHALLTTVATPHTLVRNSDSGSDKSTAIPKKTQSLLMKSYETMTMQHIQEVTSTLLNYPKNANALSTPSLEKIENGGSGVPITINDSAACSLAVQEINEREELEGQLMKPNFRVGSYTTAYMRNESSLGSLAALASYKHEEEQLGEYTTGTEDHHSSFSETAWDNYQEKYNSENYSEGFDSDAARRLMEFGDDYRNFMDSQSDCCSSLSAANNLDSLSPPRMDSQNETQGTIHDNITSSVDHSRRRRALELEYERRRKAFEVRRKSCQDSAENQNIRSPSMSLSSSANALTPKNTASNGKFSLNKADYVSRKLEFSSVSLSVQSLRRTSESDTSTRRRKVDERRRSSRNLEKCIKPIPATTSSSSCGDSDDGEEEMRNLLQQSSNRLEDTRSLKIRCHLLRPEDYVEIVNTCRDNMHCLESVLRGTPGSVLSTHCVTQTKDLLAAWSDLHAWSENAAAARQLQEDMNTLKNTLSRLGSNSSFKYLDTEPSLQIAIESLKNEKTLLQTYRTNMLRLNASVHSWLTRRERKLQKQEQEQVQLNEETQSIEEIAQLNNKTESEHLTGDAIAAIDSNGNNAASGVNTDISKLKSTACTSNEIIDQDTLISSEYEFHKHLKDGVSDMYSAWDEADARINVQLDVLTTSLTAWRQLESGLFEFQQALGQDRGTLKGLEGVLNKGQATPTELAQNVKLVAKLLSEKVNVSEEQLSAAKEHLDPQHIIHIAKFTASSGSLSDSGISDGGAISDGGLSERERRLGVLRRLAKQLECALAPGSEAMKSIAARMESAEAELKNLQNTCRDLIVRTASNHQNKQQQLQQQQKHSDQTPITKDDQIGNYDSNCNEKQSKKSLLTNETMTNLQHDGESFSKRKNKRIKRKQQEFIEQRNLHDLHGNRADDKNTNKFNMEAGNKSQKGKSVRFAVISPDSGDPHDDPPLEFDSIDDNSDNATARKAGWISRITRAVLPLQMAFMTFLFAAAMMQPNCCDNINNFANSFTPQLRYIRGPPPI